MNIVQQPTRARVSQGMDLEAAVDNLSNWCFDDVRRPMTSVSHTRSISLDGFLTSLTEGKVVLEEPEHEDNQQSDLESNGPALCLSDIQSDDEDEEISMTRQSDGLFKYRAFSDDSRCRRRRKSTLDSSAPFTDLILTGYTISTAEKRVMYHIDVVRNESQLETYTIRRSFTDFKVLHEQMSDVLEERREYYENLKAATRKRDERNRAFANNGDENRSSLETASSASNTISTLASSFLSLDRADNGNCRMDRSSASSSSSSSCPSARSPENASDPNSPDSSLETEITSFELPPLPPAGLMSFWKRHDRAHLEQRCEAFQDLLHAVMHLPILRDSYAMQRFLSVAPATIRERGSSYVSLREYSVPHLDPDEELHERRRRAIEHRRASSSSFIVTE